MEDEELIIKTLEYCSNYGDCSLCPSYSKCEDHMEDCTRYLAEDALALIKNLKSK